MDDDPRDQLLELITARCRLPRGRQRLGKTRHQDLQVTRPLRLTSVAPRPASLNANSPTRGPNQSASITAATAKPANPVAPQECERTQVCSFVELPPDYPASTEPTAVCCTRGFRFVFGARSSKDHGPMARAIVRLPVKALQAANLNQLLTQRGTGESQCLLVEFEN